MKFFNHALWRAENYNPGQNSGDMTTYFLIWRHATISSKRNKVAVIFFPCSMLFSGLEVNFLVHLQSRASKIFFH